MRSGAKRNGPDCSTRRRGRPAAGDAGLTALVGVKLTPADVDALHAYARRHRTTASAFLRHVVQYIVSSARLSSTAV